LYFGLGKEIHIWICRFSVSCWQLIGHNFTIREVL